MLGMIGFNFNYLNSNNCNACSSAQMPPPPPHLASINPTLLLFKKKIIPNSKNDSEI